MKIKDVKTYVVANPPPHHGGAYFVFLKLTTDDNIQGFGEVYGVPFHPDKVTLLIEDVVERYVVGWVRIGRPMIHSLTVTTINLVEHVVCGQEFESLTDVLAADITERFVGCKR